MPKVDLRSDYRWMGIGLMVMVLVVALVFVISGGIDYPLGGLIVALAGGGLVDWWLYNNLLKESWWKILYYRRLPKFLGNHLVVITDDFEVVANVVDKKGAVDKLICMAVDWKLARVPLPIHNVGMGKTESYEFASDGYTGALESNLVTELRRRMKFFVGCVGLSGNDAYRFEGHLRVAFESYWAQGRGFRDGSDEVVLFAFDHRFIKVGSGILAVFSGFRSHGLGVGDKHPGPWAVIATYSLRPGVGHASTLKVGENQEYVGFETYWGIRRKGWRLVFRPGWNVIRLQAILQANEEARLTRQHQEYARETQERVERERQESAKFAATWAKQGEAESKES